MTPEEILKSEWTIGYKDRGLGHGDFGIMAKSTLVVECPNKEVAEHIIDLHNKRRK